MYANYERRSRKTKNRNSVLVLTFLKITFSWREYRRGDIRLRIVLIFSVVLRSISLNCVLETIQAVQQTPIGDGSSECVERETDDENLLYYASLTEYNTDDGRSGSGENT